MLKRRIVTAPLITIIGAFSMPTGGLPLRAQAQSTEVSFAIASIKVNKSGDSNRSPFRIMAGGKLSATNNTLRSLILNAYGIAAKPYLLHGGPGWIETERYDVEARAETGTLPADMPQRALLETVRMMLRKLLENRFMLSVRRETKEMSAFELVAGKNGPKLQKSLVDCTSTATACHGFSGGSNELSGSGIDISDLATMLSYFVDRPVVDVTGIQGLFDVRMQWSGNDAIASPDPAPSSTTAAFPPTIFTALGQLGLRLESRKRPIEIYVIEHVEKPSGN